jgi:hypothetical protein
MPAVVFLEAPCRSQDLVTLKWVLRSSGYEIASTWHDASPTVSLTAEEHWTRTRMEEMRAFDTLVVLRRDEEEIPAQLGLTVGYAAARGLEVIWIGVPLEPLNQFRNVRCFPNVEVFRKHLSFEKDAETERPAARLVA